MKNEKIKIMAQKEMDIIASITLESNGKTYVMYTENERTKLGNIKVFVSEISEKENKIELLPINDDNVWNQIKEKLTQMLVGE